VLAFNGELWPRVGLSGEDREAGTLRDTDYRDAAVADVDRREQPLPAELAHLLHHLIGGRHGEAGAPMGGGTLSAAQRAALMFPRWRIMCGPCGVASEMSIVHPKRRS